MDASMDKIDATMDKIDATMDKTKTELDHKKFMRSISHINKANTTPYERYGKFDLCDLHEFKMLNGKHKGKNFCKIFQKDPEYVQWVFDNEKIISKKSGCYLFLTYCQRLFTELAAMAQSANA